MARAQERVPGVEARAGKFPGPSLIPALNAIQERLGWLPREELVALSRDVRRPLYEIEGLISFYPHFRTEPPAKVTLRACHDLSCWLQGADQRIAALRERYGADAEIEVAEASCLGRCDTPPAVAVNERPGAAADADALIDAARAGHPAAHSPRSYSGGAPWPNDPYPAGAERYRVLRTVLSGDLDPGRVTAALQDAGLLGMVAVGAEEGWVFIRHEYGPEEAVIRREIEALRAAGLVGVNAGGSGRRLSVEVFTSPGGY